MVEVSLTDDHLHLEVHGLDKLWAFKSQLDIPLNHIRHVRRDPSTVSGWCTWNPPMKSPIDAERKGHSMGVTRG